MKIRMYLDAVCLLHTSPFRTVEFLDKAITKFMDSGWDLGFGTKVPHTIRIGYLK
jgi:hypothetical protein